MRTPLKIKFTKYNITIDDGSGKIIKHTIKSSLVKGGVSLYQTLSDDVFEWRETPDYGYVISIRYINNLDNALQYATKIK